MRKLFSYESPFMQGLATLADYMLLNILFLICSIPIVTMGAAKTALYRVMFDLVEDKGNTFKRYFKSFFAEIKTITPIFLLELLIKAFVIWEMLVMTGAQVDFLAQRTLSGPVVVVLLLTLLVVGMVFANIPAQVAMFSATRKEYLRNGIYIALTQFFRCLAVSVMDLLPIIIFLANPVWVAILGPIWVFFYFSVTVNLSVRLFKKPFDKYIENANK